MASRTLAGAEGDILSTLPPWRCAGHPAATREALRALGFDPDPGAPAQIAAALRGSPEAPSDLPPDQHRGYMVDLLLDLAEPAHEAAFRRIEAALGEDDPFVPGRTLADAWANAVGRQAHHDGPGSEAALVGRALREAGATARVLRGL